MLHCHSFIEKLTLLCFLVCVFLSDEVGNKITFFKKVFSKFHGFSTHVGREKKLILSKVRFKFCETDTM